MNCIMLVLLFDYFSPALFIPFILIVVLAIIIALTGKHGRINFKKGEIEINIPDHNSKGKGKKGPTPEDNSSG